jgi:hypothetical protein
MKRRLPPCGDSSKSLSVRIEDLVENMAASSVGVAGGIYRSSSVKCRLFGGRIGFENGRGGGYACSGVPGTGVDARLFGAMTILLKTVGAK